MRIMKDSGIEWVKDIPSTWDVAYLSAVLSERKNKNIGMKENNLLSLSYGNVIRKDITTNDGLLPESFEGYNIIEKDDIVLRLTDLQNDHRSLRTGLCKERGIITSAYCTLKKNSSKYDSRFLQYYLHSFDICKGFYGMGAGVRQGLNYDGIRKTEILLPPLAEQIAIADCIEEKTKKVDALIANQEAQIEKLKAYKQSLITEVVTKGLDSNVPMKDSGVEWIGEIPKHWRLNRLKYIASYNDESLSEKEPDDLVIRYVEIGSVTLENGITNIEEMQFVNAPSRARRITKVGDVIVSTVRTYLKAIAPITEDGLIVSTGFCVIRPNKSISSKYLEYFTKSDIFSDCVSSNSVGISYPAINASRLMNFYIIEPPEDEQKRIAEYLDQKCSKVDELISIKQQKIEKLNQYKKSLIYEYVTGKKEV